MKKIIAIILIMLCCVFANAAQILWAGVNENALVHLGNQTQTVAEWISSLQLTPIDVGGRIRIGDTALPAGFQTDPYNKDSVVFFDDASEFELGVSEEIEEDVYIWKEGMYADWQPIKLPSESPSHVKIYFDIGYWDENADWDFVAVATATDYLDNIWNAHTYTTGTLAPPTETPWRPDNFYAVPEPSTALLALLGVGMLFKRRK